MNKLMTHTLKVLIVDDQPAITKALEILLGIHDLPYLSASTPEEACRIAEREQLGAVLQDMNFGPNQTSGEEGIELFRSLRRIDSQLPILIITAWASVESAVALMKEGASDYIEKPWNDDRLLASLKNLLRIRELEIENARLRKVTRDSRQALEKQFDLGGIVYESDAMHQTISLAVNVAGSNAPVLVSGPSGSGKERIAEIIQANSPRCKKPFIRVNVGAIPEELMESELFGAESGAYTGIKNRRIGHFEAADGGILFLDEIDSLSLTGQVKLLRVVQSGEMLRLGSSQPRKVDVRIISATNADLKEEVRQGRFRKDLYFRLNVVELPLPGLAQRRDDVLPLARHFLKLFAKAEGLEPTSLSPEAELALMDHTWSGNVRELENRLHRALLVAPGRRLAVADLELKQSILSQAASADVRTFSQEEEEERNQIMDALSRANGIVAHAASDLGFSRQTLYRKMTRLDIELVRKLRR